MYLLSETSNKQRTQRFSESGYIYGIMVYIVYLYITTWMYWQRVNVRNESTTSDDRYLYFWLKRDFNYIDRQIVRNRHKAQFILHCNC